MIHNATAHTAELVSKREVIPGTFHFVLHAPALARQSRPGQFVMIQVQNGTDPLLRRPISLSGISGDAVELLFQVKGRGTQFMSACEPGYNVNLLGPLGNGFIIPNTIKTAVLVAGGIGTAPLLYLAQYLVALPDLNREFIFGSKTLAETALVGKSFLNDDFELVVVSEDGAAQYKGFVTETFAYMLQSEKINTQSTYIFSCGPQPMLKRVSEIAKKYALPCQVSLEAHMACGVGACLGCVVETKSGYKRVCADGPIFDSKDIIWNHD